MNTHTHTQITPAQRFAANTLQREMETAKRYTEARIINSACQWESFPQSYSAEQVCLAQQLLRAQFGTEAWWDIATAICIFIEKQ